MTSISKRLLPGILSLLVILAFSANTMVAQGGGQGQQGQVEGETVVDKINETEETSEFAELLEQSGFAQVLVQQGPFTVLAPTNEALANGDIDIESAKQDREAAQSVVQSHLYQGELPVEEVENSMGVKVENEDGSPANGVLYVVDGIVTQ